MAREGRGEGRRFSFGPTDYVACVWTPGILSVGVHPKNSRCEGETEGEGWGEGIVGEGAWSGIAEAYFLCCGHPIHA